MSDEDKPLEITPEKYLTFTWSKTSDVPQSFLNAVNNSASTYVAYKVKTTAPKRYVVRPPQGVVEPGQKTSIKLTMVAKDAEALWRDASDDKAKGMGDPKSDDKFLVQTTVLTEKYFLEELKGQDEKAQSASLAALWKTLTEEDKASKGNAEKSIKSSKLTTKFSFPADMSPKTTASAISNSPSAPASPAATTSSSASSSSASSSDAGNRPVAVPPASATAALKGSVVASDAALPAQSEQAFAELAALRKKYDDLVAYTVVLTGERDYLQQDCEEKSTALQKSKQVAPQ